MFYYYKLFGGKSDVITHNEEERRTCTVLPSTRINLVASSTETHK